MAATISAIHAVFPEIDLFAPPAVLGSWAAVAVVVFAASLAGAWLGSREAGGPNRSIWRLALAALGALLLVGVVVVLGLAYAVAAFLIPSFAIGFVFVFALLGAPAIAGVIAVIALGERSRTAIMGGTTGLVLVAIGLIVAAEVQHPPLEAETLIIAALGLTMTGLLVSLIGLAGTELGFRYNLGPKDAENIPAARVTTTTAAAP
jgi:hypothetical protein